MLLLNYVLRKIINVKPSGIKKECGTNGAYCVSFHLSALLTTLFACR